MSDFADDVEDSPELVFALIRPVGTPSDELSRALDGSLLDYGYTTHPIKLSDLLADRILGRGEEFHPSPEDERLHQLMDEGDRLCRESGDPAAVVIEGLRQVRAVRRRLQLVRADSEDELEAGPLARYAYIFDSLKRPAEVRQLRNIYADRLVVVSLQARIATRRQRLTDLLTPVAAQPNRTVEEAIDAIIERDLKEPADDFGQDTQLTFPMADVFIDIDDGPYGQVRRLVDRLFGNPKYDRPTAAEFGMQLASLSRTRSPELGLKVGAAIVTDDLSVVAVGANVHPTESETPPYDTSQLDIQTLVLDTLRRLGSEVLTSESISKLDDDPSGFVRQLLKGQLADARIRAITEYQLPVHAEMNALLDALRRGANLQGTTMYVTAYPCHSCAKHLVALNLPVRYVEPYPKSRAQAMYGRDVAERFLPFTGIAPRRYESLFSTAVDRKNADGSLVVWGSEQRKRTRPQIDPHIDQRGIADREDTAITSAPESETVVPTDDTGDTRNTEVESSDEIREDTGTGSGRSIDG